MRLGAVLLLHIQAMAEQYNAFLMLVADAVPHMANYAVFKYPVALVIGLIAAIFVICLSVPAIVYKATSDETVIERLHNFDS